MLALLRDSERESSLITEAVENFAGSIAPRGPVVLALIEERPCFLALLQIVNKGDAVLLGQNFLRNLAVQHADTLFQPLEQPHLGIITFEDAFWREKLD